MNIGALENNVEQRAMTGTYDVDLFVIGGGSGGVRAARIEEGTACQGCISSHREFKTHKTDKNYNNKTSTLQVGCNLKATLKNGYNR